MSSIGSQSGWTPDVIYGYTGSQAQLFADENQYIFESIGTAQNPVGPVDPTPGDDDNNPGNEDPGNDNPSGDNSGSNNPGGENPGASNPGGENPTNPSNPNGGNTTTGNGGSSATKSTNSVSTTGSNGRVKDLTPKTGDGIDAKYFLCGGVLLVGVYLVIYKKKIKVK